MAVFLGIVILLQIAFKLEFAVSHTMRRDTVCSKPLGMENHQIPDSSISASSERIYYLRASQGRLRMLSFFPWLPAGWSAAVSNRNQWFQINFSMKTKVTGIATQGLSSRWSPDQWVTSYQVSYKADGGSQWQFYKQWGQLKVFVGNKNAQEVVINHIHPAFEAVDVRLHPQAWHRWISMRAELFGCEAGSTPVSSCFVAVGLEDRRIPNTAFSSSSVLTRAHFPSRARLHIQTRGLKAAGWAPWLNDKSPWLQVDLGTRMVIAGIGTQGGRFFWWSAGGWVQKFKVSFSTGGQVWHTYGKNTSQEVLPGNNNVNSLKINKFFRPFVARLVRIHPILQTTFGYLRLELYGCIDKDECASSPCKNNATCTDHVNSYSCACSAGFTGITCETDINECSSSPWLNNGSCVDHVNGFSCVCSKGFTGIKCETVVKPSCSCGLRTSRRIVGGQQALPGEWPWQAGLMVKNATQIYCGGALINNEWIVTGAHCVTYRNASTLKVVLGEYDVTRHEGIELFRDVDSFQMHPNYHLLTADFDIALVRFKPALKQFSRFISPICLPTTNDSFPRGTNCTVTGFGRLAEAGRLATTLQQAVVPIVSRDTCQVAYPDYNITPRMLCAGYASGGIDACQGDSGGPMVCHKDKSHWHLAGVISWGLGCAQPRSYGVYANVTELAAWISSALINSSICTPGA